MYVLSYYCKDCELLSLLRDTKIEILLTSQNKSEDHYDISVKYGHREDGGNY